MPTYVLRAMPEDLWTRVKERAREDHIPLRALFLRLLTEYADGRSHRRQRLTSAPYPLCARCDRSQYAEGLCYDHYQTQA